MNLSEEIETFSKDSLRDSNGLTYREFKSTLEPKWGRVWRDITVGYLMLLLGIFFQILCQLLNTTLGLIVMPLVAVYFGFWFAYLNLFLHEAAHFNLAPNKVVSDRCGNLFIALLFGQEIAAYREIHWDHHRFHGTSMDTEHSYFSPLNVHFIITSLIGVRAINVIWYRKQKIMQSGPANGTIKKAQLMVGMVAHAVFCTSLFFLGMWTVGVAWGFGLIFVYPFFNASRQLLEHRDEHATTGANFFEVAHGKINRLFGDSLLSQTFGGAGFNRHLLHHWEPQISYTNLHELETYLLNTQMRDFLNKNRTTYWIAAQKLWDRHAIK